jgi:hypothetical protein
VVSKLPRSSNNPVSKLLAEACADFNYIEWNKCIRNNNECTSKDKITLIQVLKSNDINIIIKINIGIITKLNI